MAFPSQISFFFTNSIYITNLEPRAKIEYFKMEELEYSNGM